VKNLSRWRRPKARAWQEKNARKRHNRSKYLPVCSLIPGFDYAERIVTDIPGNWLSRIGEDPAQFRNPS
jgi:hypothetical protein